MIYERTIVLTIGSYRTHAVCEIVLDIINVYSVCAMLTTMYGVPRLVAVPTMFTICFLLRTQVGQQFSGETVSYS